ncbi:MAG: hypothetical protein ACOX2M_03670 [Fastidiosipilaceae bacterium]|jgi:hypothetical protein
MPKKVRQILSFVLVLCSLFVTSACKANVPEMAPTQAVMEDRLTDLSVKKGNLNWTAKVEQYETTMLVEELPFEMVLSHPNEDQSVTTFTRFKNISEFGFTVKQCSVRMNVTSNGLTQDIVVTNHTSLEPNQISDWVESVGPSSGSMEDVLITEVNMKLTRFDLPNEIYHITYYALRGSYNATVETITS